MDKNREEFEEWCDTLFWPKHINTEKHSSGVYKDGSVDFAYRAWTKSAVIANRKLADSVHQQKRQQDTKEILEQLKELEARVGAL